MAIMPESMSHISTALGSLKRGGGIHTSATRRSVYFDHAAAAAAAAAAEHEVEEAAVL